MANGNGKRRNSKKTTEWKPTECFKRWVDVYLDPEKPFSIVGSCREAGVDRSNILNHLGRPEAVEYLNQRGEEIRKRYEAPIAAALARECFKGNVAAMRLWYEVYGNFKHKVEHSGTAINIMVPQEFANVGGNGSNRSN